MKCVQYKRRVAHAGRQEGRKAQQRCCYDSEEVFLLPHVKHKPLQFLHLTFSRLGFRFYDHTDLRAGSASLQQPPTPDIQVSTPGKSKDDL